MSLPSAAHPSHPISQQTLFLFNEKDKKEHTVRLREDWAHTALSSGKIWMALGSLLQSLPLLLVS
jgi:hypothetical protein